MSYLVFMIFIGVILFWVFLMLNWRCFYVGFFENWLKVENCSFEFLFSIINCLFEKYFKMFFWKLFWGKCILMVLCFKFVCLIVNVWI